MSDQVELSAYSEAVENLIQSERYDEAIAVCQHILSHYPKNVATYRQMAQANLAKGQLQEAAELFRRVLSADPEDNAAYAGLAAIFERQALIDEAVWHLERAYELEPGDLETRKELLRLYGERDGRPHSRVKLTPGALGRLYVREGLFNHAAQEFRSILSDSPRRLDARLALAETLWHAGQVREASQISQELLQALPYCLKANLILGTILQESGTNEGDTYLRCAEALDPTNQLAQTMLGERSPLQTEPALLPKLVEGAAPAPAPEVEAVEQTAEQPAAEGASSTGEGFEEWFAEGAAESAAEGATASGSAGMAAPSESSFEAQITAEETTFLPDWMSAPEQNAQEPVAQEEPTLPSWISEMGLPTEVAETPPTEQAPAAEPGTEIEPPSATIEPELPSWLAGDLPSTLPTPKPTTPIASSLPPWLTEFQKTHQADLPVESATSEEAAPSWEFSLEPPAEPAEAEGSLSAPPTAEAETGSAESLFSSGSGLRPALAGEDGAREQGLLDQILQDLGKIRVEPSVSPAPADSDVSGVQAPAAAEDQTLAEFEEWFQETRARVAADAAALPPTTEKKPPEQPPDWLKGLEVESASETRGRADEDKQAQEGQIQPAQPLATVEAEGTTEIATPAPMPLPQESAPAESVPIPVESAPSESDVLATLAPAETPEIETEPVELEPESEPGTVTLVEEPADRELYGEGTPTLEVPSEQPTAKEEEPMIGAPASAETAPALDASRAAEAVPHRRDPKGYAHLLRARAQCEDNRLGEALKEYDYLVQHSPRLINTVIGDLEAMVREMDVPLEAHRILGDAYTRADRLADALECYRFVLQRVS